MMSNIKSIAPHNPPNTPPTIAPVLLSSPLADPPVEHAIRLFNSTSYVYMHYVLTIICTYMPYMKLCTAFKLSHTYMYTYSLQTSTYMYVLYSMK